MSIFSAITKAIETLARVRIPTLIDRALIRVDRFVDALAQFRRSLRFATWLLLAVFVVDLLLAFGIWTATQTLKGPFRVQNATTGLYAARIGAGVPFWLTIRLVDDETGRNAKNPQLALDGRPIDMPDTPRAEFSRGVSIEFGLKPRELLFPLPAGVANDQRIELSATYTVRPHSSFRDIAFWGLIIVLLLQLLLRYRQILRTIRTAQTRMVTNVPPWANRVCALAAAMFMAVSYAVVAVCAIYAVSIGLGAVRGDALPTTTIFALAPTWLAMTIEPVLPLALLLFAALGATFAWARRLGALPEAALWRTEATLSRLWGWCGLPVIVCLLLFSLSAGGWSGHVRRFDLNYMSLAGLVPHSDSRDYFTDVYQQVFWGDWAVMGSRRPLGEAFREIVVFAAQYSYVGTLVIQLALVTVTLFFAARSIVRWFGIWAGIAFVGFIWILARAFLSTALTEPLALVCTLFSIGFLLDALQLKSLPHALVALAGLTFALMMRMGAIFLIPFLAMWTAMYFASTLRARLRLFVLACGVVIVVLAINGVLAWLYASSAAGTGSNFAWTLCGLSIGSNWDACGQLYANELQQFSDERSQAVFLLAKTWQNALQQPTVMLSKLGANVRFFFADLPTLIFEGYGQSYRMTPTLEHIGTLVLSALAIGALLIRRSAIAIAFWVVLFVSTGLSAAFVFGADGRRILQVTYALTACFLALGFATPSTSARVETNPSWRWQAGATIIAVMTMLFLVVPMVSRALAMREIARHAPIGSPPLDEKVVPGGRFISGFVVVPDGTNRPLTVPSLFASDFADMIRQFNLESDFGPFLQTAIGQLPFAFILAGSLGDQDQSRVYIVPPLVLERPDVWAWRFKLRPLMPGEVRSVFYADSAEPLP